jgi:hypothetical protein
MEQPRETITQNLAERLCWQAARRDDSRVARRLYRQQVIDGVYRLDERALLDDFFDFLHELGVVDLLGHVQGTAIQREDDDRSLIETCCIKEAKQQWDLGHPPQKTGRAVRVHVMFTLLMFALATAYRLQCEQADTGGEPVGWQRWRRQLLEHTRDQVIVFAQGAYGIFYMAEYSLLVGVRIKDRPRGIGTRQQILAKYGLTAHG